MNYNKIRSDKITKQLGVNKATAYNRLVKNILFDLVQKTNQDMCFRCGKKIQCFNEFSIEHKQPWEDRDATLFWSIQNIAFSHKKCNKPHKNNNNLSRRKIGPIGFAWCGYHKIFEPVENFYVRPANWNRLRDECKIGTKEYNRRRGLN